MSSHKRDEHGLTAQQRRFADEYRTDSNRNGTAAYRKVYKCRSQRAAEVSASKLLNKVEVAAYIKALDERDSAKLQMRAEEVYLEEKCIARSDIRAIFNANGCLIPTHELPEEVARSVSSVDVTERKIYRDGEHVETETVYRYKFWDKGRALERVSKILGLYEKDNKQQQGRLTVLMGINPRPEQVK